MDGWMDGRKKGRNEEINEERKKQQLVKEERLIIEDSGSKPQKGKEKI